MQRRKFLLLISLAAAGFVFPAQVFPSDGYESMSLAEIELVGVAKDVADMELPERLSNPLLKTSRKERYLSIHLPLDDKNSEYYMSILRAIMEGRVYLAQKLSDEFLQLTDVMDKRSKDSVVAFIAANNLAAEVSKIFGKYEDAAYYHKIVLENIVKINDLGIFAYLYPYISDTMIVNEFSETHKILHEKMKSIIGNYRGRKTSLYYFISFSLARGDLYSAVYTKENSPGKKYIGIDFRVLSQNYWNLLRSIVKEYGTGDLSKFENVQEIVMFTHDCGKFKFLRKYLSFVEKNYEYFLRESLETGFASGERKHYIIGDYYHYKGVAKFSMEKYGDAKKDFILSAKIYETVFKEPNIKILSDYQYLMTIAIKMDNVDDILKYADISKKILEKMKSKPDRRYINILVTTAEAFYLRKDFDKAIRLLQEALEMAKDLYGEDSADYKIIKRNLEFVKNEKFMDSVF